MSCSASVQKNTIRKLELDETKLSEKEKEEVKKMARFGPIYGVGVDTVTSKAKDSAWEHILQKSGKECADSYKSSIKKIEEDAIASYDASIVDELKQARQEFRNTMVRDGCFFLQLALHILGARKLLHYPEQHPFFGANMESTTSFIPAMFFPGNQIPCVVLHALMDQPFFRDVMQHAAELEQPTHGDLAKLVLYQTVVEPHRKKSPQKPPHSDILQALHSLLLGSRHKDPSYSEMRVFQDLETGSDDSAVKFPSAGELKKLGIKLEKGKRGVSNIRFKNCGYSAFLFLPPFTIDKHTQDLLTSLARHERSSESDGELIAYIRFMRDLVRTYKDFKILEKKGIIVCDNANTKLKYTTVKMLDSLVKQHDGRFTFNFGQIRQRITDYAGPPWRLISFILGILTFVQTIFTVLSFFIHSP